jgi:hypothetical protein
MGSRSIRPDTPRIELMAVQLQQAKDLIEEGSAAHARLAFILLDNAVEVMMFRNIEALLFHNRMLEGILQSWEDIAQRTGDAKAQAHRDEIKALVVSKTKRTKLERSFDAKAEYLVSEGRLDLVASRVIKKLHGYRNELYHRDRIRAVTVRTASLLYFGLACSLFEQGDRYPIGDPIGQKAPPALKRYNDSENAGLMPSAAQIVGVLRQGLHLDPASIKETLVSHLTSRLDKIDADIAWAGEMLSGLGPDAVVRLAQVHEKALPDSLQGLLDAELRYSSEDLIRWRQAVHDLEGLDHELELFAAFADIEDGFEPAEVLIEDLVERIDYEIEMEADILRGK